MAKKHNIMSLSIEPETQEYLKNSAKEQGVSVSKLVRNLVEKFLMRKDKVTIVEHSDQYIPVVLKIPSELRGDERVKTWLMLRAEALGNKLAAKESDNS
jgi:predicted methyltransferase